jgi:glycopeptide antibiotics resistance protein
MIIQIGKSVLFLMAVTFPLWVALRLAINASKRRRHQQTSLAREFLLASFLLYLVCLAAVTIVPLPMSRLRTPSSEDINLIPILHSVNCLARRQTAVPEGVKFCLENILGNIALFLPSGVMLPLLSGRISSLRKVFVVAMLASLGIEVTQLLSRHLGSYRSVDIDDIIFNTLGACLGYIGFVAVRYYAYADK